MRKIIILDMKELRLLLKKRHIFKLNRICWHLKSEVMNCVVYVFNFQTRIN